MGVRAIGDTQLRDGAFAKAEHEEPHGHGYGDRHGDSERSPGAFAQGVDDRQSQSRQSDHDDESASGSTSLGKALRVLRESLDQDVRPAIRGKEKGDWKPLVFILTDGEPTDDWHTPRQEILERQQRSDGSALGGE